MENLLYTIKSWYENKNKTGLILNASAKNSAGNWVSVRLYVPYNSQYETTTTAKKPLGKDDTAEICIPCKKIYETP